MPIPAQQINNKADSKEQPPKHKFPIPRGLQKQLPKLQ